MLSFAFVFLFGILQYGCSHETPPNIVMIVADDLGWNDVSFHGSNQIPTPNIDKLAKEGIILNNYYVLPICTPTRSAIMTGRYPIHTGMQSDTIYASNPWAVGLNETFLPEYLKSQGYATHCVGKWHVGFYAKEFTPRSRGFDSFYGYYLGKSDYWDHSNQETYWGLDLHDNEEPVFNQWGNYSTEMYTAEAEARIKTHNISKPLFLYLAYQAVHSANTRMDPIQAPDEWIKKYSYIKNEGRRKYAAVVGYMDYGIGRIYDALSSKGILDNTIIIFTTDNGGPANGFDFNWANNYPLRGVKATLFEGGVRGAGFISSKLLKSTGRVSNDLIHVTDWLPTLVNLAGGNLTTNQKLDGVDQWNTLQNEKPSPRNEILLNIDPLSWKNAALIVGDYKIIQEGPSWDGWYAPPSDKTHDDDVKERKDDEYIHFTSSQIINCGSKQPVNRTHCTNYCLFNLKDDPCEYQDLSKIQPTILQEMIIRLEEYKKTMVEPRNNFTVDPLANPKLHNGVWVPWRKP